MNKTPLVLTACALVLAGCASRTTHTREVVYTPAPAPAVQSAPVVVAETPPPPPQAESVPARPNADAVWTAGYWSWANGQYTWVPGHWEMPRDGYVWVPQRWEQVDGRWQSTGGTWMRQ